MEAAERQPAKSIYIEKKYAANNWDQQYVALYIFVVYVKRYVRKMLSTLWNFRLIINVSDVFTLEKIYWSHILRRSEVYAKQRHIPKDIENEKWGNKQQTINKMLNRSRIHGKRRKYYFVLSLALHEASVLFHVKSFLYECIASS